MKEKFEHIDDFFQGKLSDTEKAAFTNQIENDPDFAADVAMYLGSRNAVRQVVMETKIKNWEKIYGVEGYREPRPTPVQWLRRHWTMASAAAVLLFAGLFWLFSPPPDAADLAKEYLNDNLTELSQMMDGSTDLLERGLTAYNDEDYKTAILLFDSLAMDQENNPLPVEYAGLAYMHLEEYDSAVAKLDKLVLRSRMFSNTAFLYSAMALLMRNKEGDMDRARTLLEDVIYREDVGKEEAEIWLKKLPPKKPESEKRFF